MRRVRLKIDIGGTIGNEAWNALKPFAEEEAAAFGPQHGSSGPCQHSPDQPHLNGEWWGATVTVSSNFLAEYALPHYLEQPRVIDGYIEPAEDSS